MSLSERVLKQEAEKEQSFERCTKMQEEIDKLKADKAARGEWHSYVYVMIDTQTYKVCVSLVPMTRY